jgi:hypothetical protein
MPLKLARHTVAGLHCLHYEPDQYEWRSSTWSTSSLRQKTSLSTDPNTYGDISSDWQITGLD